MKRFLKITRDVSMLIYVLVTIFPGISSGLISIPAILIWLFMNFLLDKEQFIKFFIKPNLLMYSIYCWLLSNIVYIIIGNVPELAAHFTNYARIGITAVIYLYYYKTGETKNTKILIIYTLMMLLIINIITILANIKEYNISRMLSTGIIGYENKEGVGSYPYVYGMLFLTIVLTSYMIDKSKCIKNFKQTRKINYSNLVLLLYISICLYTIYVTEFSIAIFLLILGILCIVFDIRKVSKIIKYTLMILLTVIMLSPIFSVMFKELSEKVESHNLQLRAKDLAIFFSTGNIEETVDIKARLERYTKSIDTFCKNLLFGEALSKNEDDTIGGHSAILDQLARFGIIGSIPFFVFIYAIYRETYKTLYSDWQRKAYFICLTIFTVLMLINTALFVAIFYMLFVLCPMILQYLEQEKLPKQIEGEKENENTMDS